MVQLNAAALGAPTDNTNQALAEGLAGLTQGFVQGAKLKMLREAADREQSQFEQSQNERKAAQRGMALLAGEQNYHVPDSGAQVAEAAPQIQAGADAVRDATAGTPVGFMGDMLSRGAMSSSKPLGQAFDWHNLKQHQAEFMSQLQQQVAGMSPAEGAAILHAARQGFVEDANLLDRTHAVSEAHDALTNGAFRHFTVDGKEEQDPEVARAVMEAAQKLEHGVISRQEYDQTINPLRQQAHASWVENSQRFNRWRIGQSDLEKMISEGKPPTDQAVSALKLFKNGEYDPAQFQKDWPELLKGNVKYKGEWMKPEQAVREQQHAAQVESLTEALTKAQTANLQSEAAARSPMAQARKYLFESALAKQKASIDQKAAWQKSFDSAMSQQGRSIEDATKIANTATGLNVGADDGMLQKGNIDVSKLPVVNNPDGSVSTVRSISVGVDGKTYLIPTIIDGKQVSDDEAVAAFKKSGQHLGVFKDAASADAYARAHHQEMGPHTTQPPPGPMVINEAYLKTQADLIAKQPQAHHNLLIGEFAAKYGDAAALRLIKEMGLDIQPAKQPEKPPVHVGSSGRAAPITRRVNGQVVSEEEWQRLTHGQR